MAPAFALFDACKHDAVLGKLMQFNADPSCGALALDGAASDRLTKLVNALKAAPAGDVSKDDVALFLGADGAGGGAGLLAWPLPLLFPCLDLFRLLMLHPKAAPLLVSADPPVLPRLLSLLNTAQAAGADSKPAGAASLMLLRCLANAASKRELRQALAQTAADQLDALSKPLDEGPPPARLAACSVLYNLTIVDWRSLPGSDWTVRMEGWTLQALSLLSHALTNVPSLQTAAEEESLHRLLLALHAMLGGVSDSSVFPGAIEAAKDLELPAAIRYSRCRRGDSPGQPLRLEAQLIGPYMGRGRTSHRLRPVGRRACDLCRRGQGFGDQVWVRDGEEETWCPVGDCGVDLRSDRTATLEITQEEAAPAPLRGQCTVCCGCRVPAAVSCARVRPSA